MKICATSRVAMCPLLPVVVLDVASLIMSYQRGLDDLVARKVSREVQKVLSRY